MDGCSRLENKLIYMDQMPFMFDFITLVLMFRDVYWRKSKEFSATT